MEFVYMDKQSLKFVRLTSNTTHTGYRETIDLVGDINNATLFRDYQSPLSYADREYLENNCVKLSARSETKVFLV